MDYNIVEKKLRLLQEQFTIKFDELKNENADLVLRLNKIEESLDNKVEKTGKIIAKKKPLLQQGKDRQRNTEKKDLKSNVEMKKKIEVSATETDKKEDDQKEVTEMKGDITEDDIDDQEQEKEDIEFEESIDMTKYLSDNKNNEELDEETNTANLEDDGHRHVIEQRMLPTKVMNGFCFRPITGWKNKSGGFEISKELISFNPRNIKVGLYGRDSSEEIANLTIDLGVVEKAEASVQDKTVIHLYGSDLYLASQQTLLFTNLSSYTIIDENSKDKIRISVENFSSEDVGYLAEYFRRNGIYYKLSEQSQVWEVFFKKLQRGKKLSNEQHSEIALSDAECLIDSFKTFQYLDKILYSCNICGHLSTVKSKLESHVYYCHVLPKRRMSEADIVKDYLED